MNTKQEAPVKSTKATRPFALTLAERNITVDDVIATTLVSVTTARGRDVDCLQSHGGEMKKPLIEFLAPSTRSASGLAMPNLSHAERIVHLVLDSRPLRLRAEGQGHGRDDQRRAQAGRRLSYPVLMDDLAVRRLSQTSTPPRTNTPIAVGLLIS
jgi:hypothetical protein